MFQMLIHPSSGVCDYLVRYCVGCIVLTSGSACTWIPHHQQTIPLHNTNTPQVSLHNNATSSRKLLKMDVLTSETCWAVNWHNKASVIKLVYLYSNLLWTLLLTLAVAIYLALKINNIMSFHYIFNRFQHQCSLYNRWLLCKWIQKTFKYTEKNKRVQCIPVFQACTLAPTLQKFSFYSWQHYYFSR